MSYESLSSEETGSGRAIVQGLMRKIRANLDYLYGVFGTLAGSGVPNGSFEVDSDADNVPDSWTVATYPGGTVARDTAAPSHGGAALKMVHPGGVGNGGGYAVSDYIPCSEVEPVVLQLLHHATAAGMKNQVIFYWYTAAKVACATASTTVYDSTVNPTSATLLVLGATPPATARFFKVRLVGGESSVNVAGTAYWDGVGLLKTGFATAGTNFCLGVYPTGSSTNSTSYTKTLEALMLVSGVISVSLYLSATDNTVFSYARIYKNGVAVGTEHSTNSMTAVKRSDAMIAVQHGDLLQLYQKTASVSWGSVASYFRIMSNNIGPAISIDQISPPK